MNVMKHLFLYPIVLLTLIFFSCEEEKNARVQVWLTDDPGDYQEVNIDLQGVEVHSNETDHERGWQAVDVTPKQYNLLELTNGKETMLGDLELPGGRLSQVRLKLGDANTIKVNDQTYPLSTPSAQQSGLKIRINEILAEGITYKILLDFDAAKSVIQTGNGSYLLKPVIRAVTEAQDGAIKGKIEPADIVSISVTSDGEEVTTTSSDETGAFIVRGLQAGSYTLIFDGPGENPVVVKSDIAVELGVVADVGVIAVP